MNKKKLIIILSAVLISCLVISCFTLLSFGILLNQPISTDLIGTAYSKDGKSRIEVSVIDYGGTSGIDLHAYLKQPALSYFATTNAVILPEDIPCSLDPGGCWMTINSESDLDKCFNKDYVLKSKIEYGETTCTTRILESFEFTDSGSIIWYGEQIEVGGYKSFGIKIL